MSGYTSWWARAKVDLLEMITGKLLVEGFTTDDILAIRADASGNTPIYVDDR